MYTHLGRAADPAGNYYLRTHNRGAIIRAGPAETLSLGTTAREQEGLLALQGLYLEGQLTCGVDQFDF